VSGSDYWEISIIHAVSFVTTEWFDFFGTHTDTRDDDTFHLQSCQIQGQVPLKKKVHPHFLMYVQSTFLPTCVVYVSLPPLTRRFGNGSCFDSFFKK